MRGPRPHHLQCLYKSGRGGVLLARGIGAFCSDAGSMSGARPHHLHGRDKACETCCLWHEALELLAEMHAQKFEPEVITYCAAMEQCVREGVLVACATGASGEDAGPMCGARPNGQA